jgi:hypothetical protein
MHQGGRKYSFKTFLTAALDGGEWSASLTGRAWEETPGTHWTGGWVGPRACLDTEARGKILLPLPGIESRSSGSPVRSQTELPWLPEDQKVEHYVWSFRVFWDVLPCSLISSETSVHSNETTRRYIPEDYLNFILAAVRTWNLAICLSETVASAYDSSRRRNPDEELSNHANRRENLASRN